MIHLGNFDTSWSGKKFVDTSSPSGVELTILGYGDNQGNPFLVGGYADKTTGRISIRTVLLKNVALLPV